MTKMWGLRGVLTSFTFTATMAAVGSAQQAPEQVAERYVAALGGTMTEAATVAEVDALVSLYTEDGSYEHPRVGVRVTTPREIRAGMTAFLGRTRRPSIRVLHRIFTPHVVILELEVEFEARRDGGWEPARRRQVTTLELRDGRIARVIDYW